MDNEKLLNDPEHWRDRAKDIRISADQFEDPEARRVMLEIAVGYDRMATLADWRTAMRTDGCCATPVLSSAE